MTTVPNPISALLDQAKGLADNMQQLQVTIDYDAITRAAIKAVREERKRLQEDPRIVITQSEAHKRYGKGTIAPLMRRGYLQPYKFGFKEAYDEEGNKVTKTKGVIHFRVVDIEKAIEEGNVLKGTARRKMYP